MVSPPHESEWIYSTVLTKTLKLTKLNEAIHSISSVSHPIEIVLFACGYAFNPVMFPVWLGLIHVMSIRSLQSTVVGDSSDIFAMRWRRFLQSHTIGDAALVNTLFYFVSVLVTLVVTELGKASFATTRPVSPQIDTQNGKTNKGSQWIRIYGKLVQSLKSKHSFPSGDSAQAMNLCLFLYTYIPESSIRDLIVCGVFLPGVAFARVFYWCHWIEDCIGGFALATFLHWFLIPTIGDKVLINAISDN
jgi:membrane-associated phospholipid phosphatase